MARPATKAPRGVFLCPLSCLCVAWDFGRILVRIFPVWIRCLHELQALGKRPLGLNGHQRAHEIAVEIGDAAEKAGRVVAAHRARGFEGVRWATTREK